ncbi:MAG: dihydroorotate dehydrogenase-like protein [Ignavibacterium sp.]
MDLKTDYLGFQLKNPIIATAGPLSKDLEDIKKMEDSGIAAITLFSLFEEQIEKESLELFHRTTVFTESYAESTTYFPEITNYKTGPEGYLELIRKAKDAVDIPIIASLNGKSLGGWIDYAKKIQEAGADALELNIYRLATSIDATPQEIEKEYIEIVKTVKNSVSIPIAVKMHPFFTSVAYMAEQFAKAGANGLVLFNRFYQPDINLENLEVEPNVLLSTPMATRLPLRWIAILYGKVNADLAATSGIYSEKDVVKMILVGAKVTGMMSALLKFGIGHVKDVLTKLEMWLEINEYESIEQMRGSMSYKNVNDPAQFERANYMKVISSY